MKLRKGIAEVILANVINLIISAGSSFLLPGYLSVESYADLRTFFLYTSYVGVLHFGYIDGIYIKYGGRSFDEIKREGFAAEKRALALFQACVAVPVILAAFLCGDFNLACAAASILPVNMACFFKMAYQATGEFKAYRHITNASAIMSFLANMLLLFLFRTDRARYYVGAQVLVSFAVWFYYEAGNKGPSVRTKLSWKQMWAKIWENTHLGIVIMLGNFMWVWISCIDRWFVRFLGSKAEFAYYSFAVSVLLLLSVIVTAFSVTLYNFFCQKTEKGEVALLRKAVLAVGAAAITAVFPLELLIRACMEKYLPAVPVIRLLFMAQFLLAVVSAIYLNLYKALRMQKKYLARLAMVTAVAFLSNAAASCLGQNHTVPYAAATLFTAFVWLALCQIDLPEYRMGFREWIYVFFMMGGYCACSCFPALIDMAVYAAWLTLGTYLMFPELVRIFLQKIACRR